MPNSAQSSVDFDEKIRWIRLGLKRSIGGVWGHPGEWLIHLKWRARALPPFDAATRVVGDGLGESKTSFHILDLLNPLDSLPLPLALFRWIVPLDFLQRLSLWCIG